MTTVDEHAGSVDDVIGLDGPTDEELARSLPGDFRSMYADLDGVRLHYVAGGEGEPLVLLPGWPQTWWEFRKIMPELARRYRVIAVDLRGMGGSSRPEGGYDKKSMAADIRALVHHLGYQSVNLAGHDIGAMVAFSFAVNHPEAVRKLALLDVMHPGESKYSMPLLRRPGTGVSMWWWGFNQAQGLPEKLIAGRMRHVVDWLFENSLFDQASVSPRDRAIFARAYDTPEQIRATNGWYRAFPQDIEDMATYGKLTVPLLGIASPVSHKEFEQVLPSLAPDVRVVKLYKTLHWLPEEQPEPVIRLLSEFFV
ncbi:alpha/beta hydrolase [Streptomyces sp. NPDC051183]|uniref:alpha/beta fold hydrolase n=1 Tax=unclassified Streptomyces TaxID=2593676 RepID=UPI003424219A